MQNFVGALVVKPHRGTRRKTGRRSRGAFSHPPHRSLDLFRRETAAQQVSAHGTVPRSFIAASSLAAKPQNSISDSTWTSQTPLTLD